MISKFIEFIPVISGGATVIGAVLFLVTLATWLMVRKETPPISSKVIDFLKEKEKKKDLKPEDFEVSKEALDAFQKYGESWKEHITEILEQEHERKENDAFRRMVMSGVFCGIALIVFFFTRPIIGDCDFTQYNSLAETHQQNNDNLKNKLGTVDKNSATYIKAEAAYTMHLHWVQRLNLALKNKDNISISECDSLKKEVSNCEGNLKNYYQEFQQQIP